MLPPLTPDDLIIIRHAPVETPGCLCGSTDVAARLPERASLSPLQGFLSGANSRITSPALRCRQTAEAIWPDAEAPRLEPSLWEQNFGDWDGKPYTDLPDIGVLGGEALAAHRAPGGESFNDLCVRVFPTLRDLVRHRQGPTVLVAHAGIVRAALAFAIGSNPAGLKFDVANLSVTRFACLADGNLAIRAVNVLLVAPTEFTNS